MASGEPLHVAVQMLRAELVEGALVGAFQHRPQGFDAVGVHVTFDVLLQRVLDRVVVERQCLVSRRIVPVDRGRGVCVVAHEPLQRLLVGRCHHLGRHLVGLAILRAHHRGLADRAPARSLQLLALGVRHVATLPAQVGLVRLDRPAERTDPLGQRQAQPVG